MSNETLQAAKLLESTIGKLDNELEQLGRSRITVTVSGVNGQGSYNFTTIGTDANCEHTDTDAAQDLIKRLIQRRLDEREEAQRKLNAL